LPFNADELRGQIILRNRTGGGFMFRILAIDGGGIKGTFAAAVLAEYEAALGRPLVDYFDLVVGTSTGGIICLGLAFGVSADAILDFYVRKGDAIFPKEARRTAGWIDWIFGAKYDSEPLREALVDVFGKKKFGETDRPLAITSFNAHTCRPVVFKTPWRSDQAAFNEISVVDVALATAAAPTYFKAHECDGSPMLDGGVWANCPALIGIVEAITSFDARLKEIEVLSIGTTSSRLIVSHTMKNGGLLAWAKPVSSLLMHANQIGVLSQAKKLCGERFHRIDADAAPGEFKLDECDGIKKLAAFGRTEARHTFQKIRKHFFQRQSRKRNGARPVPML
jgi:patatin-like phospholipase/acyl hydrolase